MYKTMILYKLEVIYSDDIKKFILKYYNHNNTHEHSIVLDKNELEDIVKEI